MNQQNNPQTRTVIGPIEQEDWNALINVKAFVKDMEEEDFGKYFDRIQKYKGIYKDGIKYYHKH